MRKNLSLVSVSLVLISIGLMLSSFIPKTSGSHISCTGAPGELTCKQAGCHADATFEDDTLTNELVFGNHQNLYIPGQTYTFQIKVRKPGHDKFGFQIVALSEQDETNAGTIQVTDPVRTQLQDNATPPIEDRRYLTHTANGTIASPADSISWTFDWTAPSVDIGPIVFYYATNCTNHNNQNTGDELHLSTYRITSQGSGLDDYANSIRTYYDPIKKMLFTFGLPPSNGTATIFNSEGQTIIQLSLKGSADEIFHLPLLNGIYFIHFKWNQKEAIKRVVSF